MRARRRLIVIWVVAAGIALFVADRFYAAGKAADCRPEQIDGQCGLSTFVGLLYGCFAGGAIIIAATVYVAISAYRRRTKSGE